MISSSSFTMCAFSRTRPTANNALTAQINTLHTIPFEMRVLNSTNPRPLSSFTIFSITSKKA